MIAGGFVVSSIATVCDYRQTEWASDNGAWDRPGSRPNTVLEEKNPLLGPTPTLGELNAVAAADLVAANVVLLSPLPRWIKIVYFGAISAVETTMIVEHRQMQGWCGR